MKPGSTPPATIEAYIEGFPGPVQRILRRIRRIIAKAAPEAEEAIRYRMPTFVWQGNLVHFAAFKNHIGFYPTPSGVERFAKELAGYPTAKGSIRFPLDAPIPYELIEAVVAFRVEETRRRLAARIRKS